jgi:hypothetical protein
VIALDARVWVGDGAGAMAKGKKRGEKGPDKKLPPASAGDALAPAVRTFATGDYIRARAELAQKLNDPELSEGEREEARELIAATQIERGTLWVGLACVALLIIVIVVTAITQP